MNHFWRLSLPQVYDGAVSTYGFILFYYISILHLFKGSLTRDFQLQVFFMNQWSPVPLGPFNFFSKIRRFFLNECLSAVSTTPPIKEKNVELHFYHILLTPVKNFSSVTLTPTINIQSRISLRIFDKFKTAEENTHWPGGHWFMKKTWSRKSRVRHPLTLSSLSRGRIWHECFFNALLIIFSFSNLRFISFIMW